MKLIVSTVTLLVLTSPTADAGPLRRLFAGRPVVVDPCPGGFCTPQTEQAPTPEPDPPAAAVDAGANFGVDRSKMSDRERWSRNGREISSTEGRLLLGHGPGTPLPDDSAKPWLVAVAPAAKDKADLQTSLSTLQSRYRVQVFDADDWQCRDRNGKTIFLPGLTVCAADGRPVGRTADFVKGKLRAADPDFDPTKVPDLVPPPPPPSQPTAAVPGWAAPAGLWGALFLVLLGVKKR